MIYRNTFSPNCCFALSYPLVQLSSHRCSLQQQQIEEKMSTRIADDNEGLKREKRRASNRRSARKSRYREVVMMEELQENAQRLTTQNCALKKENESIRGLIATFQQFENEAKQAAETVSLMFSSSSCGCNGFFWNELTSRFCCCCF